MATEMAMEMATRAGIDARRGDAIEPEAGGDGRVARGIRTRESILDAYDRLILDAEVPPTGAELAAEAGVSARSIFTHFGDMDGVLAGTARRAMQWLVESHVAIASDLPLPERLDRFVQRQSEVLERTSPHYRMFRAVRHGTRREGCSPAVLEILAKADGIRRRFIASVFDWEIGEALASSDAELFEALMTVTSWGAWESLRFEQGLDLEPARKVMRRLLVNLLR
jgi:TetR/AcrR family transcriptional regulator of autoinduction and epiphytic fitness